MNETIRVLNFRRKFSNGHCGLIPQPQQIFFHFDINQPQVPILRTKFQPNILSRSGENDDFNSFAILSNGRHLEFWTQLNFIISEALESDHAAYEI